MKSLPAAFAFAALFALAQGSAALACACCTNTGQRYVENTKLQDYQRAILGEVRFAGTATLYLGARDTTDIKGIARPSETYAFRVDRQANRFVFSFRDEKKNEGTLTLAIPDAISVFEIDPRDPASPDRGLGPPLYKEWRLTAPFTGSGVFQAGNGGYQRITLILQGRGNSCPDAGQFTHWSISVHGPLGNYLFFGDLEKQ